MKQRYSSQNEHVQSTSQYKKRNFACNFAQALNFVSDLKGRRELDVVWERVLWRIFGL